MTSCSEINVRLDQLMPLMKETLAAGKRVNFNPRGTSMLPMLRPGVDQVTLSPLPDRLKKYDLPLYQRKNGQYVLHRVVKAGDTYTCCGDNQTWLETGLTHEQMIGLVTSFTHRGKTVSVRNPLYGLYCRYWCFRRTALVFLGRVKRKLKKILHWN